MKTTFGIVLVDTMYFQMGFKKIPKDTKYKKKNIYFITLIITDRSYILSYAELAGLCWTLIKDVTSWSIFIIVHNLISMRCHMIS